MPKSIRLDAAANLSLFPGDLVLGNAVESMLAAEKDFVASNGGRGAELVVECVAAQDFVLGTVFEDQRSAIAAGDIDPAIGAYGRGIDSLNAFESLWSEMLCAGFRI